MSISLSVFVQALFLGDAVNTFIHLFWITCVSIGHKLLASSLRRIFWCNYIHLPEFPCKIKVMTNGVFLQCVVIVYFQIRHLQPWPGVTSRLLSWLMFCFVVCWRQAQCRSRDSTVFGCSSARIAIIQISSPPTLKIVVCIILSYPHFLLGFQIKSSHFAQNFWNSYIYLIYHQRQDSESCFLTVI